MVFSLGEGHADVAFTYQFHILGPHGLGRIVKYDARAELFAKLFRRQVLQRHFIDFGDVTLRVNQSVQKTAVVGEE